ncbi:CCG-binding protein 1-like [Quercus lobata]|uniref:CCG-binding protein 1 n=1 Tax=Quercus lobata TaxID=97700 RepID=A0A7N2MYL2_QUELO|nr:CCG-binding protein 1-like [Quercus lobata]
MIRSSLIRSSCYSPLLLEAKDVTRSSSSSSSSSVRFAYTTTVTSCSSRSDAFIPKLEPFSRPKFERILKDPPLIEKSENELADYCSTLEGDDSYSCWRGYFELKELERQSPKEDVEKLILQAGGLKSLIGVLHGIAAMFKGKTNEYNMAKPLNIEEGEKLCPIPDGLPKSTEELEEEEQARMPDSPYTRMLRTKGRFPAWYSPAPDHETD